MSWWAYLENPVTGRTHELDEPHQMKGGTFAVGGTTQCELNVTYNYGALLRAALQTEQGIDWLHGKTGAATIPLLEAATARLGDDVDEDYWKPTEGNAKQALLQLLELARLRPDGVWRIS